MTAEAVAELPEVSDHLRQLVDVWARVADLDEVPEADGLSGDRALTAAITIARARHALDTLLAPYAARLDDLSSDTDSRYARWKGFPSAAALLSAKTGLSQSEAGKLIGLGRAMEPAPEVAVAAAGPGVVGPDAVEPDAVEPMEQLLAAPVPVAGPDGATPAPVAPLAPRPAAAPSPLASAIRDGLGAEKVTMIRRTLDDMLNRRAEAEALLVARASSMTIVQLRRFCLHTFAELDPEGYAAREARQRRDRYVRFYEEIDGTVGFSGRLDAASAAPIKAWMEAELDSEVFAQRDLPRGEQRTMGQIMADVFVSMAQHAAGCTKATSRPKTTLVIRSTRESLESGEGCATVDGIEAPVTIATALLMAVDSEFVPLLTDNEGAPLKLGRTKRSASRDQRLVAMERDKGCAQCHRALSRCNAHHITEWEHGGLTDQDNLVMLCVGCHHRLHEYGWGIEIAGNQVWFIPPASVDPRRRRQPGSSVRLAA